MARISKVDRFASTSPRSARAAVVAVVAVVVTEVAVADSAVGMTAVAVVVVAADKQSAPPARSVATPPDTEPATEPERPVELAEGTHPGTPAYRQSVDPELASRAAALGETWAQEYVRDLRAQSRDIVGGWPGTLREARRRVLATMPRTLDPLLLDELARIMNLAARRGWESVSAPDLEP